MSDREPTQDELLAMAYADGELTDEARQEFERRLQSEAILAREVSELKRLEVLARQCAPKEPMDYEWERVRSEPIHKAGSGLGWALFLVGAMGLIGWLMYATAVSEMAIAFKLSLFAAVSGFLLLLAITVRGRLRTLPYDPYREVRR